MSHLFSLLVVQSALLELAEQGLGRSVGIVLGEVDFMAQECGLRGRGRNYWDLYFVSTRYSTF
jgi:hypothetical protein